MLICVLEHVIVLLTLGGMVYPILFRAVCQEGGSAMKTYFSTALVYSKKVAKGLLILTEALEKLAKL